jgi:hypothetical protein
MTFQIFLNSNLTLIQILFQRNQIRKSETFLFTQAKISSAHQAFPHAARFFLWPTSIGAGLAHLPSLPLSPPDSAPAPARPVTVELRHRPSPSNSAPAVAVPSTNTACLCRPPELLWSHEPCLATRAAPRYRCRPSSPVVAAVNGRRAPPINSRFEAFPVYVA